MKTNGHLPDTDLVEFQFAIFLRLNDKIALIENTHIEYAMTQRKTDNDPLSRLTISASNNNVTVSSFERNEYAIVQPNSIEIFL
jgi:hypothetical protein